MDDFSQAVNKFLEYMRLVKNASEHTLRNYSLDLNAFKTYAHLPLSQIDKRVIRGYLADLSLKQVAKRPVATRPVAKRTVLRRLSSLRSFFKYLSREKILLFNPLQEIESPKLEKTIPHPLSYEQVERLFAIPDVQSYLGFRDRCMMELFYSSGLRVSELIGLNRSDFDSRNLRLRVMGKGKKQRVVPITKTAAQWIVDYLNHPERYRDGERHQAQEDEEAIFLNKWGKRLSVRSVDRKFDEYLQASGLSGKITPHTIRHTIATHWLEKGMDLKTIQVLLGHHSLATTTIYTQVSTRLKREVYDKAHPLEKGREGDKPDFVDSTLIN